MSQLQLLQLAASLASILASALHKTKHVSYGEPKLVLSSFGENM